MQGETTDSAPAVDLTKPTDVKPMADAKVITHVLLSDGTGLWYEIIPGSFHYYVSGSKERPVPYIQFETAVGDSYRRIEIFPAQMAAVAYDLPASEGYE